MTDLGDLAPVAVAGFGALGLSATLTEPMRRLALRYGFTDRPAAHKAHARTTPYLGGVAVVLATVLPIAAMVRHWNLKMVALVVAGVAIAALGLLDDLRPLGPRVRLVVEAAAAGAVVVCGDRVRVFGSFWPDAVLTVIWIVVLTNSFNLLDNMDGAAASTATAITGVLAVFAWMSGVPGLAALLACLAAACGGFLCHNWPPARIFLGDAGSLFIGFVISTASVQLIGAHGGVGALTALGLVTFVATVDTTLVLISRYANGRSWCEGGTDHVSHRLRRLGMNTSQVALVMFGVAAVSSLLGVLVAGGVLPAVKVLAGGTGTVATAVALLLHVPVYADRTRAGPTRPEKARPEKARPEKARPEKARPEKARRRRVPAGRQS
jgi:UDP-GlcNAc:undecaprenyl-phosphate GlcNAc-1-phosphate transferase